MKRVSTINFGDELLLGIRENSHLPFIGQELARKGIHPRHNAVVNDDPEEIEKYFIDSWNNSDILITTGGLGPTQDDQTRETIAKVLGLKLEHCDEIEEKIRARFAKTNRVPTENNMRQAMILENAEILPNPHGTAPGIWLEHQGKTLIMLPGPPLELRPMFINEVIPRMEQADLFSDGETFVQLRTCGIGESRLDTLLHPLFAQYEDKLRVGYCAHQGVVDIRLSPFEEGALSWDEINNVGENCATKLGGDFVGYGDVSLPKLVLDQIRSLGAHFAVAESCTGGLLSDTLTSVPGASKVFAGGAVTYTNAAKVHILDIPEVLIQQHGAVSAECAIALATGCAEVFGADYTLSITGFAGPDGGTEDAPLGTIFFGYHSPIGVWSRKTIITGNRSSVKQRAVTEGLDWVRRKLKKYQVEDVLASMAF